MRVIATARGFDGHVVREVDEEFDVPDGAKGSWFLPVGEPLPAKPAKAEKPPKVAKTLAEHAAMNKSDDPDPGIA